jgi:hypothetical protein
MISQRVKNLLAWSASLLPVFIAAIYTCYISVNVPFFDEWELVPLIKKWNSGSGSFGDIFVPYSGYVIPLQKASAIFSATFFHWDIRFEVAMGFCMLLGTGLVFVLYTRHFLRLSSAFSILTVPLPIMLLVFSLRQYENLSGPWGVNFFGAIFFTMAAAYLLSLTKDPTRFIGAIICAIMASLSFLNGLLIWPLGLFILILQRRKDQIIYWSVLGTAFLCLYFKSMYVFAPRNLNASTVSVYAALLRFLGLIGGSITISRNIITAGSSGLPTSFGMNTAVAVGCCLLSISAFLLWFIRKDLQNYIFSITGIIFSTVSALMIAIGRSDLGLVQVFASRYSSISLLFLASVVITIVQLKLRGKRFFYLEYALLGLILLSSSYCIFTEIRMAPYRRAYLQNWASNVRNYENGGDLTNPHFSPERMRELVTALDQMKMSVFSEK